MLERISNIGGNFQFLIAGWLILRDSPGTKLTVDWPLWWELIKQSLPFGILGFLLAGFLGFGLAIAILRSGKF